MIQYRPIVDNRRIATPAYAEILNPASGELGGCTAGAGAQASFDLPVRVIEETPEGIRARRGVRRGAAGRVY